MASFTFFIGGKLVSVGDGWLYHGGSVVKELFDVDLVSYFTILDRCGKLGYKNISKIFYDAYCARMGLMKNMKVLDGDREFGAFINYVLENGAVNLYVEHGDGMHSYFDDLNPKTMCKKLGIDEHGNRVGRGSSKGKSIVVDDSSDSEFDGYQTEQGESEYEGDDIRDQEEENMVEEYWVDCPYLSADEEDEFRMCRERRERFKRRGEKKISKKKEKREVRDSWEGPLDEVGQSGGSGPSGGERKEGNARVSINSGGNGEDIMEEIRRKMNKRGKAKNLREAAVEESSEVPPNSDSEGSYLTSSSDSDADHGKRIHSRRPRFKPGEHDPQFQLGMVFPNKKEFKKAVVNHAIFNRRDVMYVADDKKRCRVECKISDCEWKILCSIDGRSRQWMVKTFVGQHSCQIQFHISALSYRNLADWFIYNLRKVTLKLSVTEMKDHFNGQTRINVSRGQCRKAKQRVSDHYIGDPLGEFARLEDYAEELRSSNPGSTVVLDAPDGIFKRMYVCFDGVRRGFNSACRKIIGLDGCFLKGPFKGEILSAIGRDPNDQIYPIAWAVVGYECKESWKWFLELLMLDLDVAGGNFVYASDGAPVIARGEGLTFMSDQQKGLLSAINELMPSAVSRRCARHIFAKWRKAHCSEDLHKQFWITCKASITPEFLDELEVLGGMSTTAMGDFLEVPPNHWCKTFQPISCCSDVIDNNMSETFNSMIIEAGYKSIVKLFETIRKIVFKRFKERKSFVNKFKDGFGPNIWKKINRNMDESGKLYVDGNGDDGFEVHLDEDNSWVVSLQKGSCTCRMWELTGIPCSHAICVIVSCNLDVKCYVSKWYSREMFELAYKNPRLPVHSKKFWPRVAVTSIRAPSFVKFPGRPKKIRRREGWEPAQCGTKLSHKGRKKSCKFCNQPGHYSNTCPDNPKNQVADQQQDNVAGPEQRPAAGTEQGHVVDQQQDNVADPIKKRRKTLCSFCKVEGHRRDACVSNPASRRFANPLSSQVQTQTSHVSASDCAQSQVQTSQASGRTQSLLQELRQSCGTARPSKGRKKKTAQKKAKLPEGYGCFIAESGWTCTDPKTPRERVIDVPARRKTRSQRWAGTSGQ